MTNSISFVGTSDGLPSVNRGQASFLVRLAGKQILLDAGEPCSRSLLEMGENPNDIDAVIISHTHSDHVGGLPMLLQTMWLNARDRGLPIWMPRRGIKPLREWLKTCYLFDEALPFKADWRALSLRREERIGRVRMRAFATTHLASTKAMIEKKKPGAHGVGFDSFAVVLTGGSKRIAYSGDVGDPSEVAPLCVKPVDVLIVELAHFPVERLIEALKPLAVKHVVITHMGRRVKANLRSVRAKLRALRPKRVTLAKDGDVIGF